MVLVQFEVEMLQERFWATLEVALGQVVGEVEEGEVEAVLEKEAAEVGEEGQEEWGVVVVEEVEGVVATEFDCLKGIHPWVCWGTSGLECV